MYRANMRTLLAPLELDGIIDPAHLELLLISLEDAGWQEHEVDRIISKCLGELKERCFDNLDEMSETMVKLGKVSRATQVCCTNVDPFAAERQCLRTNFFSSIRSVIPLRMLHAAQC
jgi:hypothetical protein